MGPSALVSRNNGHLHDLDGSAPSSVSSSHVSVYVCVCVCVCVCVLTVQWYANNIIYIVSGYREETYLSK